MKEQYSDNQLIGLIRESSEEAKDEIYKKYKYIIEVEIKKYITAANVLGYDYNDLYQDGLVGFADAINSYRDDKNMMLSSFITLCVNRRLQASIIKAGRLKNKIITEALSLDHKYDSLSVPLKDILSDSSKNDPLQNILKEEKFQNLISKIKEELSDREYETYSLLISGLKYNEIAIILDRTPKQIDNSIQRLKSKIKKIIIEENHS